MSNQIKVNIIRRKGATTLVQFVAESGLQRVSLPSLSVGDDGLVNELELSLGIAYGLPWEEVVQFSVTPEALAGELRKRGIWTMEDLAANMQGAVSAFQSTYGIDASRLLIRTRQYQKQKGGQDNDD